MVTGPSYDIFLRGALVWGTGILRMSLNTAGPSTERTLRHIQVKPLEWANDSLFEGP